MDVDAMTRKGKGKGGKSKGKGKGGKDKEKGHSKGKDTEKDIAVNGRIDKRIVGRSMESK